MEEEEETPEPKPDICLKIKVYIFMNVEMLYYYSIIIPTSLNIIHAFVLFNQKSAVKLNQRCTSILQESYNRSVYSCKRVAEVHSGKRVAEVHSCKRVA